jgi:hypothetical protein
MRACARHERELIDGLGWAIITRPGPPTTVTIGKQVRS